MAVRRDCIQQKNISLNKPEQPKWFNKEIAKQIGERQNAYRRSKQYPTQQNIKFHKQQCRKVDRLIKKGKLENELRVAAAAKTNPKAFYAYVNSRKPIKNTIGPLKDGQGQIISSDEGMADLLNEYFVGVYTKEDLREIPNAAISYLGNSPLRKINITLERVSEKIKKLNAYKSPGPDGFYPREIKEVEIELAPHFHDIFKTSLEQKKISIRLEATEYHSLIQKRFQRYTR